mmetsp:Transcript_30213/g.33766  ORF Transcript_30213/g.33766 Transcript_30213/m.33766 type:complete len:579 (+) Transcript_30213:87-1823(+)
MAEDNESDLATTINVADVKKMVDRAERKIKKSTNPKHIREALVALYKAQAVVQAALKLSQNKGKKPLVDLDKRIGGLIETNLDELTSGPPELTAADIKFKRNRRGKDFLGEGSFGEVYKGTLAGSKVAVKIPNKHVENMEEFRREVQIMRKLFHPNIVMLIGASTNEKTGEVVIVSELMDKDLEKFLTSDHYSKVDLGFRIRVAKDVALGLNWLNHHCNIVHRDLKLGNILLDEHGVAKIADFGFSQVKSAIEDIDGEANPKGNILYMAPEVMMGKSFNQSADVYSYALILWEIITGNLWEPPADYAQAETYKYFICELKERPVIPNSVPGPLKDLIQRCWHPKPSHRPQLPAIIAELNDAYIDFKLPNKQAAAFWKRHFFNRDNASFDESISWKYLKMLLRGTLPVRDTAGLEAMMCWSWGDAKPSDTPKDTVSIEMFGTMQKIFGNFFLRKECNILHELTKLVHLPAFHGFVNREKAEFRIRGRGQGFYLIRISDSVAGYPLTITYKPDEKDIANARVKVFASSKDPSVYYYKVIPRGTEESAARRHRSLKRAIDRAKSISLKDPCPKYPLPSSNY